MKAFKITKNDSGQRLDKFITKLCPLLPPSHLYKYIRLKRIKINGKRCEISYKLQEGDLAELYLNDEFFGRPSHDAAWQGITPRLNIIYEDENILLLDKAPGIVVHEDDDGTLDTLINQVKAYLFSSGAWNPETEQSFTPALCNRIDRNTGGIVIAAKTAQALRILNDKIKNHAIDKSYLCLAFGQFKPAKGTVNTFLFKDSKANQVFVSKTMKNGAKTAITHYKALDFKGGVSLVECLLETGRTHQIRVHMAHLGHPLVGDTKYGRMSDNKNVPFKAQALYAYKIQLDQSDWECLNYLKGKTFAASNPFFLEWFNSLGKPQS